MILCMFFKNWQEFYSITFSKSVYKGGLHQPDKPSMK